MKSRVGTRSQARKLENSIERIEKNSYSSKSFLYDGFIDFFQLTITLDAEVKDYKSRVYGIIDAIGTLGGAFGIISWIVLLLYSSLRNNLYYFSAINSLINNSKNKNDELRMNEELFNKDIFSRSRRTQQNSQSNNILRQAKAFDGTEQQTNTTFKQKLF